ncbi:hypothetical protein K488DRAFT_86754 [Vararia minispora EC-137]|uniref:Uncharacterized protein n=1 Tax=Vararia minispora EC-137 TaxID=1314806 RepID=A0ACB8QI85_9AGAM|nr:hypothetical protein K488DRAFT_86754 [Vararia minispora EC-137]
MDIPPVKQRMEIRLQSDADLAHDPRATCLRQAVIDHNFAMLTFREATQQLTVLGKDTSQLLDCSDLIPIPKPLPDPMAYYLSGFGIEDVDRTCALPFSVLSMQPEPVTSVVPA